MTSPSDADTPLTEIERLRRIESAARDLNKFATWSALNRPEVQPLLDALNIPVALDATRAAPGLRERIEGVIDLLDAERNRAHAANEHDYERGIEFAHNPLIALLAATPSTDIGARDGACPVCGAIPFDVHGVTRRCLHLDALADAPGFALVPLATLDATRAAQPATASIDVAVMAPLDAYVRGFEDGKEAARFDARLSSAKDPA